MSEIGIAVGILLLMMLFVGARRSRRRRALGLPGESRGSVSLQAMTSRITELAPSLRETARVTAAQTPQAPLEAGHIWASPNGRRVYIN